MLWACIALPQLALDTVLRRVPDPLRPWALVTGPAHLRSLHAVNPAAAAAGLTQGMRLSAARALSGEIGLVEYDPQAEAHWQRFLAAWGYRHSSQVSAQWPGAIVLEVRASFRLFGPWPRFEARLREELSALGFNHRIALAPTPRAAHVFASLRDAFVVTTPEAMRAQLAQVPVRRAHLPGDTGLRLHAIGVRTLGALRRLPSDSLRRRFGVDLLTHLDRLYGDVNDPLECYIPPDHFDAGIELGHEVESHQALLFPLRRLIGDLCTYLSMRDGGVQRFVLRLEHERRYTDIVVGLLSVEREPAQLFELTRSRLEQTRVPRPVIGLRLLARELPPFIPAARDLFDPRSAQAMPWPQLCERLRARLGDAAVYRIETAADPRPEHAWKKVQATNGSTGARANDHASVNTRKPKARAHQRAVGNVPARVQPLWLLPHPVPLCDICQRSRIVSGPERLESGWWDGDDTRRDYYVLETAQGQRAWVFAPPGQHSGWMLHGWFG